MAVRATAYWILAVACGVLALAGGLAYLALPWQPERAPFDVLGVLLLLANAPKLIAAAVFWTALVGAVALAVRALLAD